MDTLRELIQIHGACATRAMLDEAIKQEQQELESRLKDINLYMSGNIETGTLDYIQSKISSVEEQLSKAPSSKAAQRAAEAAKRAELTAAGVDPHDKLTRENLQKWLNEGKSFSQIARDEVGLRQEEVSAAVKKYKLKPQKEQPTLLVTKEPADE
jgi:hypothetical protein